MQGNLILPFKKISIIISYRGVLPSTNLLCNDLKKQHIGLYNQKYLELNGAKFSLKWTTIFLWKVENKFIVMKKANSPELVWQVSGEVLRLD